MEAVEQGVRQAAANVLIIEYPYKTLQQVKNLLGRFGAANACWMSRRSNELQELASCG